MTKRTFLFIGLMPALLAFSGNLLAAVKPNSLFSDHVVLQQGVAVPVWGTAAENEQVTVEFAGQRVSTQAVNGKWMVKLQPLKAGGPFVMKIAGENETVVKDVMVGEVWFCSGQSNMERQLGPRPPQPLITNWEKERDAANFPLIREYYVPLKSSASVPEDIGRNWKVCSPQTVSDFSAVGYFFAKHLYNSIKIPVGIIFSAYGGTPAEYWSSRAALEENPELKPMVEAYDAAVKKGPMKGMFIGSLYNAMVLPVQPFAIKGVAWYQGEANNDRATQYQTLLPAMIRGWRKDWGLGDFPFLIVQIAPFKDMKPEIREAQMMVVQKTPNTALIVTTDCGDAKDIHPANKQPVGERLALAARALAYKEKIQYSGPLYSSMKIMGNKAVLSFKETGRGLMVKGDSLTGFMIAGDDGVFVPAKAIIRKNKVIVSHPDIPHPVVVRYGWTNAPVVNLFNKNGLPASPFRTDVK